MSKVKKYTIETLLPLNVSYDSDHGLTQEDVDMVNSLVEVIESTRSKHTPKIGDRVVYTQKGGEYHPHGLIEKKHEDRFYVCLDPFIPFVWESDTNIKVDVSGGPFYHADADKFKFVGWTEADFKEWGHCGATANGTVRFKAKVPLWAYSEPNPLYGDFTTKDWKKITLRKRVGPDACNLYDSMQIAFRDEEELQEYVNDHNGTIFTCSDPTLFVLWCYNRQIEFLPFDEWNKIDAEAVERRLSYSPEQVKIVKDTQNHISTFYRIKPESDNTNL